jgi:hypothetical protein
MREIINEYILGMMGVSEEIKRLGLDSRVHRDDDKALELVKPVCERLRKRLEAECGVSDLAQVTEVMRVADFLYSHQLKAA